MSRIEDDRLAVRARARRAVESHLGSGAVAKVIYGSIIGLALVVALSAHPPGAGSTIAAIVGTAVAVGLAEVYSEVVGYEARTRRAPRRQDIHEAADDAAAVVFGAAFPTIFFVLARVGAIELHTAFTLAKWTGVGLIAGYGFAAARLRGAPLGSSILHGLAVGTVGAALIAAKAVLH